MSEKSNVIQLNTDKAKGVEITAPTPKDPNYEGYGDKEVLIKGQFVLNLLPTLREIVMRERSLVYEEGQDKPKSIAMTELGAQVAFIEQNIWNWHLGNVEQGLTIPLDDIKETPTFEVEKVEKD